MSGGKRVLVTGARGFVGRQALPALQARGYEVHAVGRTLREWPGVQAHPADLLDRAQAAKLVQTVRPTHLLHLAWYTEHGRFWTSPQNFAWATATLALVQDFHAAGGRRAVVAGSCAEYDWTAGRCDERQTPRAPQTLYGRCKAATHLLFEGWAALAGLSAAWGHVFHLYGPHEAPDRFVASVIRALLRDADAPCTQGTQQRDFLHVADAGDAFAALLHSDVQGAVNLGSGVAVTLADVGRRIAALLQRPERLKLGARETPPGDPPVLLPAVERLQREVGWTPRFDLDAGLRDTIDWWRQAQDLEPP